LTAPYSGNSAAFDASYFHQHRESIAEDQVLRAMPAPISNTALSEPAFMVAESGERRKGRPGYRSQRPSARPQSDKKCKQANLTVGLPYKIRRF